MLPLHHWTIIAISGCKVKKYLAYRQIFLALFLLHDEEIVVLLTLLSQEVLTISKDQLGQPAIELFTTVAPVFPSKGEMRKMVQGGGVSLNKEKLTQFDRPITAEDLIDGKYLLAQKGKKNYFLLTVK